MTSIYSLVVVVLFKLLSSVSKYKQNMKNFCPRISLLILFALSLAHCLDGKTPACKASGRIRARKPPPGHCNTEDEFPCCIEGKFYTTYKCSPPVSSHTKAVLTLNSFEKGGDGNGPGKCDNKYHSDKTPVVALSTGWYNRGSRCLRNITISAGGRTVNAMVVDECDSSTGCDENHDYQPPCPNNSVVASIAVWKALGVPESEWAELDITWSDA